jgi:3-oxoacyl-[acyl-carrier protein] reductase
MDLELKDKKVFIAGSSRGIGLAIARVFCAESALVWGSARARPSVEVEKEEIFKEFSESDFLVDQQILELEKSIEKKWGKIDVLVFNVGSGLGSSLAIPSDPEFQKSFHLNFTSALNTLRALESLLKKSASSVVLIGSIAGVEHLGAPTEYSTSKAALIALSKELAHKWASFGIRVNTVSPGNILFGGGSWERKIQEKGEQFKKSIEAKVPMKRFGTPEEVAEAVVFLSSKRASFITGCNIVVDGGQTHGF